MHTCRSGTSVIARRPWPGPWSSTIVPVSAMPSRAPVTTRVERVELGGGQRPSSTTAPGDVEVEPAPARRPARPAGSAAAHRAPPARRPSTARRRRGSPRPARRTGRPGRSPAGRRRRGAAGSSAGRAPTPSRAARTRPGSRRGRSSIGVLRRCAATRPGTTPRGGAGRSRAPVQAAPGPGEPAGRAAAAGERRTTDAGPGPGRRGPTPARPTASRRASLNAHAAALIATRLRPWARRRRGGRRRPGRAGATSTYGMSMRTGQTSKQAPHSVDA